MQTWRTTNAALLITLYALIIVLVGCADKSAQLPRLSPGATVLAFGDSLTFGSGAPKDRSYPAVLAELSGFNVINAGNPGEISADGLQRLESVLSQYQPQLLILCHGGNDMLRKLDLKKTRDNIRNMVTLAKSRDISVVILGVPKPKLFLMSSAQFYSDLAKEFKIPIETEIIPSVVSDSNLKSDAIHPNSEGYQLIAEAVYKLLRNHGAL